MTLKGYITLGLLLSSLSFAGLLQAQITAPKLEDPYVSPYGLENEEQDKTYARALKQIRCVVCQNQSIGDSATPEAAQMREQIKIMIKNGLDEGLVAEKMIELYGTRVSYTPPTDKTTLALWFAPYGMVLLMVIAVIHAGRQSSRRRK